MPRRGFGSSVALSGDRLFVGGPGSVHVYQRLLPALDADWAERPPIEPPDTASDVFGYTVAVDGDRAVVGDFQLVDPASGGETGGAFVFERSGEAWQLRATIPTGESWEYYYGTGVAIDCDTIAIGSRERSEVHAYARGGDGTWTQRGRIFEVRDVGESVGGAIALSGPDMVLGKMTWSSPAPGATGKVLQFRDDGAAWERLADLVPPDLDEGDNVGSAVAITPHRIVVGADLDDTACALDCNAGAVYVFPR